MEKVCWIEAIQEYPILVYYVFIMCIKNYILAMKWKSSPGIYGRLGVTMLKCR